MMVLREGDFRRDEGLTFCLGLAGCNRFSMSHRLAGWGHLLAFGKGRMRRREEESIPVGPFLPRDQRALPCHVRVSNPRG